MIGFISSYDLFSYVLSHLVIPIVLIVWLWVFNRCKLDWILKFALTITYLALLYLCGFRRPPSYFLRYIIVFICIITATLSCLKIRYLPIWCPKNFCGWISPGIGFACLCTLVYFCIQPINACLYQSEPVHLDFPFGNGIYIIQEGGDGRVLPTFNYHYQDARHMASGSNYSMQYAVDIEKLDGYGRTSKVPFSHDLEGYNIFNEELYSPCEGEVVSITDGYPNESLTSDSHPYNTGNTIIIKSDDIYILSGLCRV